MEYPFEFDDKDLATAYKYCDRLSTVLQFVECAFQYMKIDGYNQLQYVANGLNGETYYEGIEAMIEDIKEGTKYPYVPKNEIEMSIYLSMKMHVTDSTGFREIKYPCFFYFDNVSASVSFSLYKGSPEIEIDLTMEIPAEKLIGIFRHFNQTILPQLELKINNETK